MIHSTLVLLYLVLAGHFLFPFSCFLRPHLALGGEGEGESYGMWGIQSGSVAWKANTCCPITQISWTGFSFLYACFIWGPHPVMLKAYSWFFCTPGLLLLRLWELYGMPEIKSWSTACKARKSPILCTMAPAPSCWTFLSNYSFCCYYFFCFVFELYSMVLRSYPWLCAQGFTPGGTQRTICNTEDRTRIRSMQGTCLKHLQACC